jgi:hypothetical protein
MTFIFFKMKSPNVVMAGSIGTMEKALLQLAWGHSLLLESFVSDRSKNE